MISSSNIATFIMPNALFWQTRSNGVRWGLSETFVDGKNSAYYTPTYTTIFDSGTSAIFVPKSN